MERRFHSPYRYWMGGFGFELGVLIATIAAIALIALAAAWLAG